MPNGPEVRRRLRTVGIQIRRWRKSLDREDVRRGAKVHRPRPASPVHQNVEGADVYVHLMKHFEGGRSRSRSRPPCCSTSADGLAMVLVPHARHEVLGAPRVTCQAASEYGLKRDVGRHRNVTGKDWNSLEQLRSTSRCRRLCPPAIRPSNYATRRWHNASDGNGTHGWAMLTIVHCWMAFDFKRAEEGRWRRSWPARRCTGPRPRSCRWHCGRRSSFGLGPALVPGCCPRRWPVPVQGRPPACPEREQVRARTPFRSGCHRPARTSEPGLGVWASGPLAPGPPCCMTIPGRRVSLRRLRRGGRRRSARGRRGALQRSHGARRGPSSSAAMLVAVLASPCTAGRGRRDGCGCCRHALALPGRSYPVPERPAPAAGHPATRTRTQGL